MESWKKRITLQSKRSKHVVPIGYLSDSIVVLFSNLNTPNQHGIGWSFVHRSLRKSKEYSSSVFYNEESKESLEMK